MEYEAENELNLIPSKQNSTKENKSVEMLDLLRSVQKELSNLRTDVNTSLRNWGNLQSAFLVSLNIVFIAKIET